MSKQVESAITQSRGESAANYLAPLKKGAQVLSANIGGLWLSGTVVSGQTTRAINHGIGRKPKFVMVHAILTLAQAISAKVPQVNLAAASAATSTNFYVISNAASNAALKYAAYLQF